MKNKTSQAIGDAISRLATGEPLVTNGKMTAINVAREAGISKATLYRYFESDESLRGDFEAVSRNTVRDPDAPLTVQDALKDAHLEIKDLRRKLADAEKLGRVRAQQIFLLWAENKALNTRLRIQGKAEPTLNVVAMPAKKR